jgi:hypothetical protein
MGGWYCKPQGKVSMNKDGGFSKVTSFTKAVKTGFTASV